MYLNNFEATAKASQPLTVLCIEVDLIDALSSAFLASHCAAALALCSLTTLPSSENVQRIKRASVSTETTFVHLRELLILKNKLN